MKKTTAHVNLRTVTNQYTNKRKIRVVSDYVNAQERPDQKAVRTERGNCLEEKTCPKGGERHGQDR